jgi:hypothetical protein
MNFRNIGYFIKLFHILRTTRGAEAIVDMSHSLRNFLRTDVCIIPHGNIPILSG